MSAQNPPSVRHLVGRGVLTWPGHERRSDRYGTVGLQDAVGSPLASAIASGLAPPRDVALDKQIPEGTRARLVVQVQETRVSEHIGDLFRGIFPSTPLVDDVFVLGEGLVFYDHLDGWELVGLRPDPPRDSDWLDPHQLYRVHSQTVDLMVEVAS